MKTKHSFYTKYPILISLLSAGVIVTLFFIFLLNGAGFNGKRDDFTIAFNQAYAAEIEPNGTVREFDLVADETQLSVLNGIEFEGFSYNGEVPGPIWRIQKGDTLKINFQNELDQTTTVHFHGIRVPNQMDGVPEVTQPAIEPGESFIYEFTPKDAGTFWFHPHVRSSEQVEKGLYGVIVVEDPDEPSYSQDKVWVIDDWRLKSDGTLDENFNNGHDLMHDGRWGNVITVDGDVNNQMNAQPGERIRLRLVNVSNARIYQLNFGELEVKAIAVDGMLVKENFDPTDFELAPGNRLDVDLIIPSDSDGQTFSIVDTFISNETTSLGTIQVSGQAVKTPTFNPPKNPTLPDWSGSETLVADKVYNLKTDSGTGMMAFNWTLNGKAYPDYDPLTLELDKFQIIEFNNESGRLHPMHLHGQFFKVLSRNDEAVDEPYFRDTVLVHPNESVKVGLVPLDEGKWMQHCHILEHAEAGMMSIVEVK